jgi:hypothetical protein
MSEATFDREDGGFTFTDADFERRYYAPEEDIPASGSSSSAGAVNRQTVPGTTQVKRSPNKFMRTLLRRRLASAAR